METWKSHLITFVAGLLLGSAFIISVFRNFQIQKTDSRLKYEESLSELKKQILQYKKEIEISEQALQKLIYEVHHHFENPLLKRIRGLILTLQQLRVSIRQNLSLINKPTDYRYAKVVLKDWNEIDSTLDLLTKVAKELEDVIIEKANASQNLTR